MTLLRLTLSFYLLFFTSLGLYAQNNSEDLIVNDAPYYFNLKKALRNKKEVYKLNLSSQNLTEFPIEILDLKELRYLILDSNEITSLPDSIGNLEHLEVLSLGHNNISSLPQSFGDLDQLKYLDLYFNQLESFPTSFYLLRNLQRFYLSHNKFKVIPTELMKLQALTILVCAANKIEEIPEEIGHLYNLEVLSFSNNNLTSLPSRLYELTNLKYLYVNGNQIKSLSPDIYKLKSLEILSLNHNLFEGLPEEIGELQLLQRLFVSSNQLNSFPDKIHNMVSLEILTIDYNPFKTFPNQVAKLKKLESIYIEGISLNPFPQALYDLQNRDITIYGTEGKELYEVKLLSSRAKNKRLTRDYEEAIEIYKELLLRDTNNVEGIIGLANSYLDQSAFKKAESTCYRAFSKNPTEEQVTQLNIIIENSTAEKNKSTELFKTIEERLLENPNDASPYFEIGQKYYFNKDFEDARKFFINALKIDDNHAQTHLYLALSALYLNKDEAFIYSILRYYTLQSTGMCMETSLPFLFNKLKMNTGVKNKKGGTLYYDDYIVKDEVGRILYKSSSPQSDLLASMLTELLKGQVTIIDSSGEEETSSKILEEILYKNESNESIFKSEFEKFVREEYDQGSNDQGLYQNYYQPFYLALIKANHLPTFSYYITGLRQDGNREVEKWIIDNQQALNTMHDWIKSYKWATPELGSE